MKDFTKNEIREIMFEKLRHDEKGNEMRDLCFEWKKIPAELVTDFVRHLIESFELSINDVYYNAGS